MKLKPAIFPSCNRSMDVKSQNAPFNLLPPFSHGLFLYFMIHSPFTNGFNGPIRTIPDDRRHFRITTNKGLIREPNVLSSSTAEPTITRVFYFVTPFISGTSPGLRILVVCQEAANTKGRGSEPIRYTTKRCANIECKYQPTGGSSICGEWIHRPSSEGGVTARLFRGAKSVCVRWREAPTLLCGAPRILEA